MKTFSQIDGYFCALLNAPEELDVYADISNACYLDKVINPSVDDDGAADVIRKAKNEGISYWQSRFESDDFKAFVVFRRDGQTAEPIGLASVVIPTQDNDLKCPLMCNAHILANSRQRGLSHLLIDSCVKYISQCTRYNDVHVLAHKDNSASIAGLKKKGFFVLKTGDTYTRFLGRVPLMHPRPSLSALKAG